MRLSAAIASLSMVVFGASCTDNDDKPVGRAPFTIWILDERLTLDGEDKPVAHVPVALDPPGGGERVTKTTEADGHVTFEADFSRGGASVTVLSEDHVYVTMLEASPETARARPNAIGKPPSDLVILPPRLDRVTQGRTVELRGRIFGKADTNDVVSVAVSSLPRLGTDQALETTYVLRAPRDRPFFLLGHQTKTFIDRDGVVVSNEILKSFRIDLPARTDDELLDLDLPPLHGLTTRLLHVHAEPPRGASPFGAGTRAYASVGSADSGLTVGVYAETKRNSDGRTFDVDVTRIETDVGPERLLSQVVLTAPDGSQSVRTEPGIMADGAVFKDFPLPPSIPDPDANRTIRDPIPLDGFPPGADLLAKIYAGGGQLLWILYGPPGGTHAKTFTIPYRGEVTKAVVGLFALSLSARTGLIALPSRGEFYRYTSTFRDIQLVK